jgi:hypothetical protein
MFLVFARRFKPFYVKLEEFGELPQLTNWFMTFESLNAAWFYLPILLLAIGLLAVDALVVRHLRPRGKISYWLWVAAVALAAIPVALLVQFGLLSPVFRNIEVIK